MKYNRNKNKRVLSRNKRGQVLNHELIYDSRPDPKLSPMDNLAMNIAFLGAVHYYWSSTVVSGDTRNSAWLVYFGNGLAGQRNMGNGYQNIRCVCLNSDC